MLAGAGEIRFDDRTRHSTHPGTSMSSQPPAYALHWSPVRPTSRTALNLATTDARAMPSPMMTHDVVVRRANSSDFPGILELARRALGWSDADASFLWWKHQENPLGESPMWI